MTLVWTSILYPTALDDYYNPAARNVSAGTGYILDFVDDCVSNHPNTLATSILAIETKLGADGGNATNFGSIGFTGIAAAPSTNSLWVDSTLTPDRLIYTDDGGIDINLSDHNTMDNLAVGDVHTQYALLAGRAGGQALIGGTASGERLSLQSTAHATRGYIRCNDNLYAETGHKVGLDIAVADDDYNGTSADGVNISAGTGVIGTALFLSAAGTYINADATDMTAMPCTSLALSAGTGVGKRILLHGMFKSTTLFGALTPGGPLYMSTTGGLVTQTAPSGLGEIVQPVGYAITADIIYFNPTLYWHEVV